MSSSKRTSLPKVLTNVVILIVLFDARTSIAAPERLLKSAKNTQLPKQRGSTYNVKISMEVIETIVIQNADVEGKETVVDTDKSKAGKYPLKVSPLSSSHRMKRGVPGECAVPAFCRGCCNKHNLRSV